MKIKTQATLLSKATNFGVQKTNKEDENKYHKYPLKYLAYSNDFGVALKPIIGNTSSTISWIPTISYVLLAANHSTKNSDNNSKDKFKKELFFQCTANLALPFLLIETTKLLTEKIAKNGMKNLSQTQKKVFVSITSILVLLSSVRNIDKISNRITNYFFKNRGKINENKETIGEQN